MPGHSHALHRAAASSPCHKNLLTGRNSIPSPVAAYLAGSTVNFRFSSSTRRPRDRQSSVYITPTSFSSFGSTCGI